MEICIDTSTRYASVAISEEGHVLCELAWRSNRNHSKELLPNLNFLLKKSDITMVQIEAVIVTKGPGAFSALRVGMSTAKAFAAGHNIPVVGVHSMRVEIDPYTDFATNIIALLPAGRGRVYVGCYEKEELVEPGYYVSDVSDFLNGLKEDRIYCGESAALLASQLPPDSNAVVMSSAPPTRRPSALASIGYSELKLHKKMDQMPDLLPIYVSSAQINSAKRISASEK